jgi:hypothetical protein
MRESQLKMVEKKDIQNSLRAFAMTHEVEKPVGTPTTKNIHAEMDVVKVRLRRRLEGKCASCFGVNC